MLEPMDGGICGLTKYRIIEKSEDKFIVQSKDKNTIWIFVAVFTNLEEAKEYAEYLVGSKPKVVWKGQSND